MRALPWFALAACCAGSVGCQPSTGDIPCRSNADCPSVLRCLRPAGGDVLGVCQAPSSDALRSVDAGPGDVALAIAAPRPIAPLSTATVTSQTPRLTWALPAGTDGALIDLCSSRSCSPVARSLPAAGTSLTLGGPLGPGVWFWRLRGTRCGAVGAAFSPTWQFRVGARSASVDASWGATLDLDGDGYDDLAVAAPSATPPAVYVYRGGPAGLSSAPAATIPVPGAFTFTEVADAGDTNGDGFVDLAVFTSPGKMAWIFDGGSSGIATAPSTTLTGTVDMRAVGDVNGDGYADLSSGSVAESYLYLGSATGLETTPSEHAFTAVLDGLGDLNGDGFADVGGNTGCTQLSIYDGGPAGLPPTASATRGFPSGTNTLGSLSGAGDTNGDGFADLVFGAYDWCRVAPSVVSAYLGGASGIGASPAATWSGDGSLGIPAIGAGDVNADGYADVLVGDSQQGLANLYLGGPAGPSSAPSLVLRGPSGTKFPRSATAGDFRRRGSFSLALSDGNGSVYVYQPSTGATPVQILTGPTSFGASLAGN